MNPPQLGTTPDTEPDVGSFSVGIPVANAELAFIQ
jgi:hypothetical protein